MTPIPTDNTCGECKHYRGYVNGRQSACDAFPDGAPSRYIVWDDPKKYKECNNGIGYEPIEDVKE